MSVFGFDIDMEEWKKQCGERLGKGIKDDYTHECCDGLLALYADIHSMIYYLETTSSNIFSLSLVELATLVGILESIGNNSLVAVDVVSSEFEEFRKDVLSVLRTSRKGIFYTGRRIGSMKGNVDRVYHSCVLPPDEKVKLLKSLSKQSRKLKNYLRDANTKIVKTVKLLQEIRRFSDLENMDKFHEELGSILESIHEALKCLCCMEKTLSEYAGRQVGLSAHPLCEKEAFRDTSC